jgi:hypothetical protein
MSAGILEEIVAGRLAGIPRMTVQQFERYMESGIAGDNLHCELMDGYPVIKDSATTGDNPMIMGARHALVVNALTARFNVLLAGKVWSATCQTPIVLNDFNVLEPDLAVIQGRGADYMPAYPGPDVIQLVIEVSDSSLEADRITKLEKYARAAIPVYWIVNLRDEQLEQYLVPDSDRAAYLDRQIFSSSDGIELKIGDAAIDTLSVQAILDGTI